MALFLFTKAILENRPIQVFNNGEMMRDFTYIDDIVEGIIRVTTRIPTPDPTWSGDKPDPARSPAPYALYNIGNNNPVQLGQFIRTLKHALGKEGRQGIPAHAARRRARHLCRCGGSGQ